MNEDNKTVIKYEEVKEKLKNMKWEEMNKKDVFDRYIAYGNYEELNNPEIQKLLIKNGYANELMDMVTIITDEEVIKMLYQSKALENYNKSGIRLYHGKISEIIVEKNGDIFNINYAFKKFNNMNLYFKGEIIDD